MYTGVPVGHALDRGVALANPAGHEDDLGGERVGLGREDPHALHHRASLRGRLDVLEAVVCRELALELGLDGQHSQQ